MTRHFGIGDLVARSAARVPGKIALVFGELRQTYTELDESINRTANALRALGVAQRDRVAILSRNHYAFVVLHFALARLGAVSVPMNFMLTAREAAYILGDAGAKGFVAEDHLLPVAIEAADLVSEPPPVRGVIGTQLAGKVPTLWQDVSEWMRYPEAMPPVVPIDDDAPIQLMYTSGTESNPKGAVLTSRSLLAQYTSCIADGAMDADDIELHALPLYHCAQLHCFLSPGLYLGGTNIVTPGADAGKMLELIEREQVTKLFCPPTIWISLLRHPSFGVRNLSSLRKGYYGASSMPMELVKELFQSLPSLQLFNFYGQTEMSPLATVLKPKDQLRKLGSAGLPAINVETKLVDEDDRPVRPGIVGEIVHRGPHVMLRYWNDPERTAEAFRNGWFHSGDLGVFDEEGYLTVVDRKKDMIKTGGENVASREVEEVLYTHPAVREAAVVGIKDPVWIEAVTAAVVVRGGSQVTAEELIAFCRQRLAGFKTPKRVAFLQQLPRNASGKILKRELRTRLQSE